MKNTYEELFDAFLNITEFRLLKHNDGTFSLEDRQCANLGDIEDDRFETASEVLDRMDVYIQGYLAAGIEDALNEESITIDCDWKEYGKYRDFLPDYGFDFDLLDMIVNHSNEVDLNNCDYSLTD